MNTCRLCHKKGKTDNVKLFKIPKDEEKRDEWSKICGIDFKINDGICEDHFSSSDLIIKQRKILLNPSSKPFIQPNKNISAQNLDLDNRSFNEFKLDKGRKKCRCCITPSTFFVQLDNCIELSEGIKKTYKDLFYEITNFCITSNSDNKLPQQICLKCADQLKSSYNFIQQACYVSKQYIKLINHDSIQEDIKDIEHLQETLIELAEISSVEQLKVEPLSIPYDRDIKEEGTESEIFTAIGSHEESQGDIGFLQNCNIDNQSSDEEDTDEPESVKDFDIDLNTESIARCCDICQKVYRNEKFLKIHKRYTHMPEENKRPCPLCSYKASRISAIKVHMGLVHGHDKVSEYFKPSSGDSGKKYACNLCPRLYGHKDSLRKHKRIKHMNKSTKDEVSKKLKTPKPKEKQLFLCTYCGQSYNSKSGLQSHALTHTGERPFSCEICRKPFKRLKDLQLHRVIHSDEKPYQCSECGKAFKRVDKLKIHMRVHSELRPYKCNECEKTFKYPSVLRTHMHIHTGQTPFSCKTCGEAFSLRTSLNNHCLKNGHVK